MRVLKEMQWKKHCTQRLETQESMAETAASGPFNCIKNQS
jgi:hypothetical protein